jgi:hypothetical protein
MTKRTLSHSVGSVPFGTEEMISGLKEFADLYESRPIRDNSGGQLAAHLFYSWFVAKKMQPKFIIESGVYKGQGTWAFEMASPSSTLICLDPYPQYENGYQSNTATYIHYDFSQVDWSGVDKESTLCFFDDHQNALQRVVDVGRQGFKTLMFEDNYPPNQGDCLSLKQIFESQVNIDTNPGSVRADEYLSTVLKTYYEMPPIYDLEQNRWGEDWLSCGMNEPLHKSSDQEYSETFLKGMNQYTWINYLTIQDSVNW